MQAESWSHTVCKRSLSPGSGVMGSTLLHRREWMAAESVLSAEPGSSCPGDRLILAISWSAPGQPGFVFLWFLHWCKLRFAAWGLYPSPPQLHCSGGLAGLLDQSRLGWERGGKRIGALQLKIGSEDLELEIWWQACRKIKQILPSWQSLLASG